MSPDNPFRLPRTVVPRQYRLSFALDVEGGDSFTGQAAIAVDVRAPVDTVLLNAADLSIDAVAVSVAGGPSVPATAQLLPQEERLAIRPSTPLAPGRHTLHIRFTGTFAAQLRAFYRVDTRSAAGEPAHLAVTNAFPTDARRVFPCWDEPDFKATFVVAATVPAGSTALSNAPETSSDILPDGRRRVSFAETMPMSTYLLTLVVGPLELTSPVATAGGIPVRIAAAPGEMGLTAVAQAAAVEALDFLADYFGVPCPTPKMDHVAIPNFAAGAMENLGVVTYRREALLADPARSSLDDRRRIASTVAHETSHMWFGDLVTMAWWNGCWLNEAFATFMAQMVLDATHPEWDVWTAFAGRKNAALAIDALSTTRPIDFPVVDPAAAYGMFDVLTYTKGAAVIRMLEQHLGPRAFRRGIHTYLERHRHGNATTADLWAALESCSTVPVAPIADSWITQGGFPLVSASLSPDGQALTLSQSRFRYDGAPDDRAWEIPVVVGFHGPRMPDTRQQAILGRHPLSLPLPPDTAYVLVNEDSTGFFRVRYDERLWPRITESWAHLADRDKLSLLEDAWALVQAGRAPVGHVLRLWSRLADERHPDVWQATARGMTLLLSLAPSALRPSAAAQIAAIASPALEAVGWQPHDGESAASAQLRAALVRLLGTAAEDRAVVEQAQALARGHLAGTAPLAQSLMGAVMAAAAVRGTPEDWARYREAMALAPTPQEHLRYHQALAQFRDPQLVDQTLRYYLSSDTPLQNRATGLGAALSHPHSARAAWTLLEQRWDEVLATFPTASVGRVLQAIGAIVDPALANRIRTWLDAHPVPPADQRLVAQAREMQAVNQRLASELGPVLDAP